MRRTHEGVAGLADAYRARIAERTPRSQRLRRTALQHLPRGVGAQAKSWAPLYAERAAGGAVFDVDGNCYVDCVMGLGPNLLGHAHPAITEAAAAAMARGSAVALATASEVELARRIAALVPSMEALRFVNSGSEATMMAARVARAYTGRPKVAKFEGHYHGQHDGALVGAIGAAVDGPASAPRPLPDCAGLPRGATADTVLLPWEDPAAAAAIVEREAGDLAAVICEPVPFLVGAGIPPRPGVLECLREVTRRCGVLLIYDEVVTGFRLAGGGAAEHFGVAPDLHTFGKAIGGGFPIGVFGGASRIMDAVLGSDAGERSIFQSGTFSGNPVAMAAGVAFLDAVADGAARRRADALAARLRAGLAALAEASPLAMTVTGISSWFSVLFTGDASSHRALRANDRLLSEAFALGLLAGGVYLKPAHPGVTCAAHTEAQMDAVLATSEQVLGELAARIS